MRADFSGEVAAYYARHRRGYPPQVLDALIAACQLDVDDTVLDLGCGTGQLTLPLAARVGTVIGMDPEPDMLAKAREAAHREKRVNVTWVLGADRDLPTLGRLLGARTINALTVAVAVHFMDRDTLFADARHLLRPGGGIAVITNGAPLWAQDAEWSVVLRDCLQRLFGHPVTATCQTDETGRRLNQEALVRAGYRYAESFVRYDAQLTVEDMVGGVFSAMSAERLPSASGRAEFTAEVRGALGGRDHVTERVQVWSQFGVVD
ncbi:class I SAM-dependent methyltransferase [Verrucosispora sp. WMMC514]|uniref:class I SAM-dependent methyltransferase n=1 Tax=Verrucosispora sp. WMMC514 TaxID=3015156 RepID=UPI00248C81BD|nr:class I SAM-dependent methyltransferase [Verrucosispora sp. WMMC514]WBB90904.1 class I SAM-dependent methyltransferase [Verrucosispora sp. WMMC514]